MCLGRFGVPARTSWNGLPAELKDNVARNRCSPSAGRSVCASSTRRITGRFLTNLAKASVRGVAPSFCNRTSAPRNEMDSNIDLHQGFGENRLTKSSAVRTSGDISSRALIPLSTACWRVQFSRAVLPFPLGPKRIGGGCGAAPPLSRSSWLASSACCSSLPARYGGTPAYPGRNGHSAVPLASLPRPALINDIRSQDCTSASGHDPTARCRARRCLMAPLPNSGPRRIGLPPER